MVKLLLGDSLERLKELDADSVDAVVTDPPYGLAFMNKHWDYDVPSVELWREVLRVLKPGGHLLSFGGTRTYHRMVVAIEDAGFEIRDQVMWIYGSGFPKSQDVSKAIDKQAGAERTEVLKSVTRSAPTHAPESISRGEVKPAGTPKLEYDVCAPATPDAKRWQGWGTALKPANEPIVLARKPLEAKLTVAANVLKHGTGAINVDASRIEAADQAVLDAAVKRMTGNAANNGAFQSSAQIKPNSAQGRWPANVLFDECAAEQLDFANAKELPARYFYCAKSSKRERNAGLEGMPEKVSGFQKNGEGTTRLANKAEREAGLTHVEIAPRANHHPTVKPIKLMEYLVRMITPPGGIVLDPFMGSGTTGCAAVKLGFQFIGIEREAEYLEIARRRIEHTQTQEELPLEAKDA